MGLQSTNAGRSGHMGRFAWGPWTDGISGMSGISTSYTLSCHDPQSIASRRVLPRSMPCPGFLGRYGERHGDLGILLFQCFENVKLRLLPHEILILYHKEMWIMTAMQSSSLPSAHM